MKEKLKKIFIYIIICVVMPMMFACCAGDDGLDGKAEALPGGLPVLFSSGAGDASVSTRATVLTEPSPAPALKSTVRSEERRVLKE